MPLGARPESWPSPWPPGPSPGLGGARCRARRSRPHLLPPPRVPPPLPQPCPHYWVRQQQEDAGREEGWAASRSGFVPGIFPSPDSALERRSLCLWLTVSRPWCTLPIPLCTGETSRWGGGQRGLVLLLCSLHRAGVGGNLWSTQGSEASQRKATCQEIFSLISQHHQGRVSSLNQERSNPSLWVLATCPGWTLGPKEVLLNELVSGLNSGLGLPGRSEMPRTRGPDC